MARERPHPTSLALGHLPQRGRLEWVAHTSVPSTCMRLSRNKQRTDAALLQRIPSALAEIQRNPLQPEPPNKTAARTAAKEAGGPGESLVCDSPGRSLVLSRERESTSPATDELQKGRRASSVFPLARESTFPRLGKGNPLSRLAATALPEGEPLGGTGLIAATGGASPSPTDVVGTSHRKRFRKVLHLPPSCTKSAGNLFNNHTYCTEFSTPQPLEIPGQTWYIIPVPQRYQDDTEVLLK